MSKCIDLTGKQFGRLVAIKKTQPRIQPSGQKVTRWLCRCDCGKEVVVDFGNLRTGNTQSCGCYHIETLGLNFKTHGLSKTPEYMSWKSMIQRCEYPKNNRYHLYGGRGIKVSPEWHSFETFLSDMGEKPTPKHTLDRIDVNGNYQKENCRWATQKEQQRNRGNNLRVTWKGVLVPLAEAAELSGINYGTLLRRVKSGWSESELFLPVKAKQVTNNPSVS